MAPFVFEKPGGEGVRCGFGRFSVGWSRVFRLEASPVSLSGGLVEIKLFLLCVHRTSALGVLPIGLSDEYWVLVILILGTVSYLLVNAPASTLLVVSS